jgi:anti-sigma-K factor RskA
LDADHHEGELILSGLSAPANDRCYQLWLFDSEHPAGASLAVFDIDSASRDTRVPFRLSRPFAENARLKVSLEPRGGSPAPKGPVMLESR